MASVRSASTIPHGELLVKKTLITLERSSRNVHRRRNGRIDSRHRSHRLSREAMNTR
jgi:hypothetical protein